MPTKVKSFSIGFEQKSGVSDELYAARQVAKHIGCEHTEAILTTNDIMDSFDDLIRTIDQPSYDGANIYFVSKAASKYVSVALSGLGGDEMFFGYPHFTSLYKAAQQKVRFTDHMYRIINDLRPNRFTNISALRCQSLPQRYAGVRRILNDNAIVKALSQTMNAHFSFNFMEAYIQSFIDESLPSLDQTVLVECRHYLRNTLLRDADVMSMGHGIEVRPVMLDNILVEHVSALPQEIKVKNGWHKALLIDSIRDLLPPDILNRPKKGFELPLGYWLRTVLRQRFFDCIESPTSKLIFNKNFLDKCKENIYNTGMTPLSWTILILVSWIKEYNCVISD
jgi:asparagine synthase (glutamine-hydrolysing)